MLGMSVAFWVIVFAIFMGVRRRRRWERWARPVQPGVLRRTPELARDRSRCGGRRPFLGISMTCGGGFGPESRLA